MGCKVQYGITFVCGDGLYPGGIDPTFYVGYVSELSTKISTTQAATISSLSFKAYQGLVKFEGQRFAHMAATEYVLGGGGNGSFTQKFTLKVLTLSVQDDVEMQRLLQAQDAFVIYRNNRSQFFIMGAANGLRGSAGPLQASGQNAADDVTDTVILEGVEITKPLRFEVTDLTATIAYLDARVI